MNKLARDVDVDSLESSLSLLSSKHTKKMTASSKSETSPHAAVALPKLVNLSACLPCVFVTFGRMFAL